MPTVLMPVDFSEVTESMIAFAAAHASKLGAVVCVLHVSGADLDDPEQGQDVLQPKLDEIVRRLEAAGCEASSKLVFGPTIPSILEQLRVVEPMLVIVGSYSHGVVHDLIVGSVTQSLLHAAACPVLVVPHPRKPAKRETTRARDFGWEDAGYPFL